MKKLHNYYSFHGHMVVSTPSPELANQETLAKKNLQRQVDFKIHKTLKKMEREDKLNNIISKF